MYCTGVAGCGCFRLSVVGPASALVGPCRAIHGGKRFGNGGKSSDVGGLRMVALRESSRCNGLQMLAKQLGAGHAVFRGHVC